MVDGVGMIFDGGLVVMVVFVLVEEWKLTRLE